MFGCHPVGGGQVWHGVPHLDHSAGDESKDAGEAEELAKEVGCEGEGDDDDRLEPLRVLGGELGEQGSEGSEENTKEDTG